MDNKSEGIDWSPSDREQHLQCDSPVSRSDIQSNDDTDTMPVH
jgi:hypothetical protein